ncbi:prolipoprotein diacylglyceryl transferase family protein [Luteimonas sp. e5]
MVSIGPFSVSLLVLLLALAIAAGVTRWLDPRPATSDETRRPRASAMLLDMLLIAVLVARLAFVASAWSSYADAPLSILRIGDGGFLPWPGIIAGLAWGLWRSRRHAGLARPVAFAAGAGVASWLLLGFALGLLQASVIRLPEQRLARLEGGEMELAALAGKPVVVNLWATWCPPCLREMPMLAEAQRRHGDVHFVFVNQAEDAASVRAYLQRSQLQLDNLLLDPFSSVAEAVGSRGLPTTLFFDAQGRLVHSHVGELSAASLDQRLQRIGTDTRAGR